MNAKRAIFFLGTTLSIFAAFSARAADFTWDAPPGCPDRDALRWRIEDALGTSLAQAAPLNFTAKVQEKSASHWVVALDATRDSNQGNVQHRTAGHKLRRIGADRERGDCPGTRG